MARGLDASARTEQCVWLLQPNLGAALSRQQIAVKSQVKNCRQIMKDKHVTAAQRPQARPSGLGAPLMEPLQATAEQACEKWAGHWDLKAFPQL